MKKTDRTEAMELALLYNAWLDENSQTKSDCTIRSYEATISSYMEYLSSCKGYRTECFASTSAFSEENVLGWMNWMKDTRKDLPQSCNVRLSNLKAFLRYISRRNVRYASTYLCIKENVKPFKAVKSQIKSMTKEAVKALLSTPDTSCFVEMRDLVIMSIMYVTGCRIQEALSIKLGDLNLNSKSPSVTVMAKGNCTRSLYLPKRAVKNIKEYIRKYHSFHDNRRYLFYSSNKGPYAMLSQECIRKRLRKYSSIATALCSDVPNGLHSHQFRHSMAVHQLEDGINIVQLSKELGHSKLETTMIYLDVLPGRKEKAIAELEAENIKELTCKWKGEEQTLKEMFIRKGKNNHN